MYIDSDGKPLTDQSQNGHLAAGVPGTIAGLFESANKKPPFKTDPASHIDLAEESLFSPRPGSEKI